MVICRTERSTGRIDLVGVPATTPVGSAYQRRSITRHFSGFFPTEICQRPKLGRAQTMAGKFVIKKSGGQYHFVLKAVNGEIIATSERYTSKSAAKNGIESVKTNAPAAKVDDETGK
jgi:uncharacterized protein YegP (UPF0339 family)